MYRDAEVGNETLAMAVEKDIACLDGSDADSEDAYEHPNRGKSC